MIKMKVKGFSWRGEALFTESNQYYVRQQLSCRKGKKIGLTQTTIPSSGL
jgi:hypothetical protein